MPHVAAKTRPSKQENEKNKQGKTHPNSAYKFSASRSLSNRETAATVRGERTSRGSAVSAQEAAELRQGLASRQEELTERERALVDAQEDLRGHRERALRSTAQLDELEVLR
jgi:hypothetical protein